MHTGSCLCGGVRFTLLGTLEPIQVCHCGACRRAQGSAFAANIPVADEAFVLESGEDLLQVYESSPGKDRVFCRTCGSPIFSRTTAVPGVKRIRTGLLAGPVASRPAFHAFVEDAADWWTISDDLPRYPGRKPA